MHAPSPPSLPAAVEAGLRGAAPDAATGDAAAEHLARWLADRTFRVWQPQLHALIEAERWDLLLDCFFRVMPFGTGGRRGPVGVGPNRFNPWTLGTSVQGHVEWLRARHGPGTQTIVIGHDVRRFDDLRGELVVGVPDPIRGLTSRDFARIAAEVYAAAGFRVLLPPAGEDLSTPELSFQVRHQSAVAGLMITASHNPPDDNGGKLYGPTGGQLIPPEDEDVARRIDAVDYVDRMSLDRARAAGLVGTLTEDDHQAYLHAVLSAAGETRHTGARVVFTPLHGTGSRTVAPVLAAAGFEVTVEPDQRHPDGSFPTVPFRCPNPEVPEALEAAVALAERLGADVVMGCDPDADRLGLAVRERVHDPSATDPVRWRTLTGNEIAALVCHQALRTRSFPERPLVFKTLVTSTLVQRVAEAAGAEVRGDLLVGFKYIGAAMDRLEADGELARFGAGLEESHGVLVSPALRDKDAAGGALALAQLASKEKARGRTLVDTLESLWAECGYVANVLRSAVMRGARGRQAMAAIQASVRARPPERIGERRVLRVTDRLDEQGGAAPIRSGTDATSRDLLVLELDGDARVILRPSGTEPKTKVYAEICGEGGGFDRARRRQLDQDVLTLAEDALMELLDRADCGMPRWALRASDLLSIEHKAGLVALVDDLASRTASAAGTEDWVAIEQHLDRALQPLGPGAKRLVAPAIEAWAARLRTPTSARVKRLFD